MSNNTQEANEQLEENTSEPTHHDSWSEFFTSHREDECGPSTVTLEAALKYRSAGLSVIPTSGKVATVKWDAYKIGPADEATLSTWFLGSDKQIAIVCGEVSGKLEVIDFDERYNLEDRPLFDRWKEMVDEFCPGLVERLVKQKSQNNGFHVFYRCAKIEGNIKLAQRETTDREKAKEPKERVKTLIETRGEGGYILVYPSTGYSVIANSFENIPEISPEGRETLIECASTFNHYFPKSDIVTGFTKGSGSQQKRPGDEFNERGNLQELLEEDGWHIFRENEQQEFWCRPGKDKGVSATYSKELGLFYVFSSNAAPFDSCQAYSKFAAYAVLKHGGDFSAAAKDLAGQGYGSVTYNESKYEISDDCFYRCDGKSVRQQISNFVLTLKESRVYMDRGIKDHPAMFSVELRFRGKQYDAEISADQLYSQKELLPQVIKYTKLPALIPGRYDDFLEAVLQFSDPKEMEGFTTPGWSPDLSTYVTPAVVITKDGVTPNDKYFVEEAQTEEIGKFDFRILDQNQTSELFTLMKERLTHATQEPIALSMLGYSAYAVIEPILFEKFNQNRFGLFISGPTGVGKSFITSFFYKLFGNFRSVPSWTSTGNSLNQMGHYMNGALLLIDDFKEENVDMDAAMRLFQNYADRTGRSRLNRSAELRETQPMRCGLITNGEHSVTDQASTVARIVNLEMTEHVNEAQISNNAAINRSSALLAGFFPPFIHAMLNADWNSLRTECEADISFFQQAAGSQPNATRVAGNHATLVFATRQVVRYLYSDQSVQEEKVTLVRDYLLSRMRVTLENVSALQNHEKFIALLQGMHIRNEVCLTAPTPPEAGLNMAETRAQVIGHVTRTNRVYLDLPTAYDMVLQTSRRLGRAFTYPLNDLRRDLIENEIIAEESEVVKISGKSKRMYHLLKNFFEDPLAKSFSEVA